VPRSIVAIVGRPNVGKSTLFNRLVGWRKAIVDPISGLTRDRLYGVCEWRGYEFTVVDTAGLEMDAAPVAEREFSQADIEAQTRVAIEEANAIVFLLDVRQGLTAIDRDIAQLLRRSGRPVIVAATIDVAAAILAESSLSFLGLGFPPDIPTWGRILFDAKDNLDFAPHWAIFPGTAIFLTVLSINYIGDGLRDALDPRRVLS